MSVFPTDADILAFLADNPDQAAKRDIARAFGIRGADRITLKQRLRHLQEQGLIAREGGGFRKADSLPPVFPAQIVSVDDEGDLLVVPRVDLEGGVPERRFRLHEKKAQRRGGSATPPPGVGDIALVRLIRDAEGDEPGEAGLIKVIGKPQGRLFGVVRLSVRGPARLDPVDRKADVLAIPEHLLNGARDGDLVAASRVPGRSRSPEGRVEEVFGQLGTERAISQIAILRNGLPDAFPAEVVAHADRLKPAARGSREDWRDLPLITIDPVDAKDHDDAVHAAPDPDPANAGGFIVTVAIADVAYYVRPQGPIDREARARGNSVYFPDRVIPMLPERLSTDLCSLRAGEERPALAIRLVIGRDGRKKRHSLHRVWIRLHAGLAYEAAQAAVDGRELPEGIPPCPADVAQTVLGPLWQAYGALRAAREKRSPLELDLPERKLVLDADGKVVRVRVPERLDAHRLIEEFMIQANVAAAELLEAKRTPCLYRVHEPPSLAKFEGLRVFLKTLNISIAGQSALRPQDFNRILEKARGSANETLVSEMVLRSQAQAVYAPDNLGHFGLNLSRYAHFTSPIRRYSDLLVHRALLAAYGLGEGDDAVAADTEVLARLGEHLSGTERRAMLAERETTDRLVAAFLSDQIGARFAGRITGVVGAGLFVRLAETGADGFVPVSALGQDYFAYDEVQQALAGTATGLTFQLGDDVDVRLDEAAPVAGALRFTMLSPGKPGHPPRRGSGKGKGPAHHRTAAGPRHKGRSAAAHLRDKVRKARGR